MLSFKPLHPILWLSLFLLSGCNDKSVPPVSAEQIQQLRDTSKNYESFALARMQADTQAMQLGQALLTAHCGQCHGEDAPGLRDATDLATGVFDYGSSADAIRTTITAGRHSTMPALGSVLGEVELGGLVAYIRSFNTGDAPTDFLESSKKIYATRCVQCHGPAAHGNPDLGSSNLADAYWQHGGSMMNVRLTITRGVESVCPAQTGILSATEIELLVAYILKLREL